MGVKKKGKQRHQAAAGPAAGDAGFENEWEEADLVNVNDDKLWKRVDVDESLMYGPVGGFMGLEELDGDYDLAQDQDGLFKVKVRKGRAQGKKKKAASQDGAGKKGTGVAANNETKKAETPGKVRGFVVESMAAEETEKGKEKGTKAEQQQQRQGKKRKRQDTTAAVEDAGAGAENEEEAEAEAEDGDGGSGAAEPKKKKRKRNKKKSKAGTSEDGAGAGPATGPGEETVAESGGGKGSESAAAAVDMSAWDPFDLHPLVIKGLAELGYTQPTPIQQECLPPAIFENRDIMGAAETGSGKTLAFALPIIHKLQVLADDDPEAFKGQPLQALVLCPTRELAIQVKDHMVNAAKYTAVRVAAIVGGMAVEKQLRVLRAKPHIVVATPGRLWELMKTKSPHVSDLTQLRFLVLDEADRMVEKNHFADLTSILATLPPPSLEAAESANNKKGSGPEKKSGKHARHGKGKAATAAALAEEEESESQDGMGDEEADVVVDAAEVGSDFESDLEDAAEEEEGEEDMGASDAKEEEEEDAEIEEVVYEPDFAEAWENATDVTVTHERQTMVFSATLTLEVDKLVWRKDTRHGSQSTLESLRERLQFREGAKVLDLSAGRGLASALTEGCITCLADEKDFFLYYFLQRYPGRTLVFVNSIDCIRHLTPLLQLLGLEPLGLHANMQQRQRLKNLDRFRSRPHSVLVATDVAARGLDIKGVQHVIHYQLPRTVELYVHRSGRTARAQEGGVSVMLLGPEDLPKYKKICKSLDKETGFNDFPVDMTYLPAIKNRVNLARKIDKEMHQKRKERTNDDWFRKAAEEMDIVLDESLLTDEKNRKEKTAADKRKEAELAKMQSELRELLREPLLPKGVNVRYLTSNSDLAGGLLQRETTVQLLARVVGRLHSNGQTMCEIEVACKGEAMPLTAGEKSVALPAAAAVNPNKKAKTRRR